MGHGEDRAVAIRFAMHDDGTGWPIRIALYISHRFSTARMADRISVLEHGRLIEAGTHDELMLHSAQYPDLFELQAASYR